MSLSNNEQEIFKHTITEFFLNLKKLNYYKMLVTKLAKEYTKKDPNVTAKELYEEMKEYSDVLISNDSPIPDSILKTSVNPKIKSIFNGELKIFNKQLFFKNVSNNNKVKIMEFLRTLYIQSFQIAFSENNQELIKQIEEKMDTNNNTIDTSPETIQKYLNGFFNIPENQSSEIGKLISSVADNLIPIMEKNNNKKVKDMNSVDIMNLINNPNFKLDDMVSNIAGKMKEDMTKGKFNNSKLKEEVTKIADNDIIKSLKNINSTQNIEQTVANLVFSNFMK